MDLYNQINNLCISLNQSVKELSTTGREYATAYQQYRMLLAKELLRLKTDGMPVTIAYDIARGKEEVATAKFEELSKEALYRANLENINSLKLQIKVLENQYDKEWGNQYDN